MEVLLFLEESESAFNDSVMLDANSQLETTQNHLGRPVGMSVEDSLDCLNSCGELHTKCWEYFLVIALAN